MSSISDLNQNSIINSSIVDFNIDFLNPIGRKIVDTKLILNDLSLPLRWTIIIDNIPLKNFLSEEDVRKVMSYDKKYIAFIEFLGKSLTYNSSKKIALPPPIISNVLSSHTPIVNTQPSTFPNIPQAQIITNSAQITKFPQSSVFPNNIQSQKVPQNLVFPNNTQLPKFPQSPVFPNNAQLPKFPQSPVFPNNAQLPKIPQPSSLPNNSQLPNFQQAHVLPNNSELQTLPVSPGVHNNIQLSGFPITTQSTTFLNNTHVSGIVVDNSTYKNNELTNNSGYFNINNVYVKVINGVERWDDTSGNNKYYEVQIQPSPAFRSAIGRSEREGMLSSTTSRQSGEIKTIKIASMSSINDFVNTDERSPETINVGNIGTEVISNSVGPRFYRGFIVISVENRGAKVIVKFDNNEQESYVYKSYKDGLRYVPEGSTVAKNKYINIYFGYKFTGSPPNLPIINQII